MDHKVGNNNNNKDLFTEILSMVTFISITVLND